MRSYIVLVMRGALLAIFVAAIALIAELFFVFVMRTVAHSVRITSFGALILFATMMGFLPVWPSPSRISQTPINLLGRVVLLVEFTTFVAVAMYASSRFMGWRHIAVPVEIWFAAYAYGLVLIVTLVANFNRLKREFA
jgi:hypothetical protein